MFLHFGTTLFFLILRSSSGTPAYGSNLPESCTEDQLRRCADNAEPLLKNSDLVVPDSPNAVNRVCSLWTELTSCINNYTRSCMSRQQRMEFDRTFKDPVMSMSNLCQNPDHRNDYLAYAPCVKKISTDGNYCGNQYRFLIDLVSGSTSTIKQICCARAKFRNCILAQTQTPNGCDSGKTGKRLSPNVNSTTMAVSILDKSLAFITQRCTSSSFHEADCPGIDASAVRVNSKGPLSNPELELATSGGNGLGSQFQLGQGQKPLTGTGGKLPSRKPTTSGIIEEKPKTDKLSSSKGKVQQTRPANGQNGNDSGVSSNQNYFGLVLSLIVFVVLLEIIE